LSTVPNAADARVPKPPPERRDLRVVRRPHEHVAGDERSRVAVPAYLRRSSRQTSDIAVSRARL